MAKAKIIAAILVAAYVIGVFVQNSEPVDFKFLFLGTIRVSRTLLIIVSALLGSAVTLLAQVMWHRRVTFRSPRHHRLLCLRTEIRPAAWRPRR